MIIVGPLRTKMYLPTELFLAMSFTFSLLMYHSAIEFPILEDHLSRSQSVSAVPSISNSLYFVCFLNKFIEVKVKSKEKGN